MLATLLAFDIIPQDEVPAPVASGEPVTVDDVKLHCRIDLDVEDALIAQKIKSAREWVEIFTGRIVVRRSVSEFFNRWGAYIALRWRPIASIDQINYLSSSGSEPYAAARITLEPYPTRIYPASGRFPSHQPGDVIEVAYTAGYSLEDVPHVMIEAILTLTGGLLSKREGGYEEAITSAKNILRDMRRRVL